MDSERVKKTRDKRRDMGLKEFRITVHPEYDNDLMEEFKKRSIGYQIWVNAQKRGRPKKRHNA